MVKHLFKSSFAVFAIALVLFTVSCEKEDSLDVNTTEIENYVESSVYDIHERSNCGKFGCYEFMFPIFIEFSDETTIEAGDYEALKAEIRAWKEANPDATERPTLSFPLEVLSEDGEVISVNSREELFELRRACRRSKYENRNHRWLRNRGHRCFKVVFPVTLAYPDNTKVEYIDRKALKEGVRSWKADNPDATERPEMVFPIEVELEDGTTQKIETIDDLKALKDSCSTAG